MFVLEPPELWIVYKTRLRHGTEYEHVFSYLSSARASLLSAGAD
jgi:hypothetical protein